MNMECRSYAESLYLAGNKLPDEYVCIEWGDAVLILLRYQAERLEDFRKKAGKMFTEYDEITLWNIYTRLHSLNVRTLSILYRELNAISITNEYLIGIVI